MSDCGSSSGSFCQGYENFGCGGYGGWGYGGGNDNCGYGYFSQGCAIPQAIENIINAAGDNCVGMTGSGVSDNGHYADNASGENCSAGTVGTHHTIGSGVAISSKVYDKVATNTTAVENNTQIDLGNAGPDMSISDGGGSGDTFVFYTGTSETISVGATVGTNDWNNTLYGGGNTGGDTLSVVAGNYNLLEDGSGNADYLSVGAGDTAITSNGNLLEVSDTAGDDATDRTFTVPLVINSLGTITAANLLVTGSGNNNSLIAGNAGGTGLTDLGDVLIVGNSYQSGGSVQSNSNLLEAGNGDWDQLSVDQGSSNVLIAGNGNNDSESIESGNKNYMKLGNGNFDSINVPSTLGGSYNTLLAGYGNGDQLSIGTGNDNYLKTSDTTATTLGDTLTLSSGNSNTLIAGDGSSNNVNGGGDVLTLGTGDNNILAAGNGQGDVINGGSELSVGQNTFIVGSGDDDLVNFGTSDSSSVFAGDGSGDVVNWGSGNGDLVCVGDGTGDLVTYGSTNCSLVQTGDGAGDVIGSIGGGTTANNSTFAVGNGANDQVVLNFGDDNLLQCGDGNGDFLGIGSIGVTGVSGLPPFQTITFGWLIGAGNNNVLEAGNGNNDLLLGGAGNDTLVAGGSTQVAAFDSVNQTWSGSFGDTLTGSGYDTGGYIAEDDPVNAPLANFDIYVLNCQGGDLVQDTMEDFDNPTSGVAGNVDSTALIANFGGSSQSEVFVASSGGSSSGSSSCGSSCGSGSGCGTSGTYETVNSFNAIDVTDMAFTSALSYTATESTAAGSFGSEIWTFSNGTDSVTLDLLGNFVASGFSFSSDAGLENQAATLETGGLVTQSGDTVITYTAPSTSCGSGSSGCGDESGCGSSSSSCGSTSSCGSSGGSSCSSTGSSGGSSGCGSSSSCGGSTSSSCFDSSQFLASAGCH